MLRAKTPRPPEKPWRLLPTTYFLIRAGTVVAIGGLVIGVWEDPKRCGEAYGVINHTVAEYWREHFDMTHRIRTRWASGLGHKLSGKLHVYVGAGYVSRFL